MPTPQLMPDMPAGYGTPKQGIQCVRCDDWGTVVITRGHTSYEEFCPIEACEAGARVRQQRSDHDHDR